VESREEETGTASRAATIFDTGKASRPDFIGDPDRLHRDAAWRRRVEQEKGDSREDKHGRGKPCGYECNIGKASLAATSPRGGRKKEKTEKEKRKLILNTSTLRYPYTSTLHPSQAR
jgi:hypothetical protein